MQAVSLLAKIMIRIYAQYVTFFLIGGELKPSTLRMKAVSLLAEIITRTREQYVTFFSIGEAENIENASGLPIGGNYHDDM